MSLVVYMQPKWKNGWRGRKKFWRNRFGTSKMIITGFNLFAEGILSKQKHCKSKNWKRCSTLKPSRIEHRLFSLKNAINLWLMKPKAQLTDQIKQSVQIYCFWIKSNHATFVINRRKRKCDICNQEGAELISTYVYEPSVTLIIPDAQVSGHGLFFPPVFLPTHTFVFKIKNSFLAKLGLKRKSIMFQFKVW